MARKRCSNDIMAGKRCPTMIMAMAEFFSSTMIIIIWRGKVVPQVWRENVATLINLYCHEFDSSKADGFKGN